MKRRAGTGAGTDSGYAPSTAFLQARESEYASGYAPLFGLAGTAAGTERVRPGTGFPVYAGRERVRQRVRPIRPATQYGIPPLLEGVPAMAAIGER